MKLSLNWLNEYVDLAGILPEKIVERLSMTTAEVEGFEVRGNHIKNIVVGEIVTCVPHPTSKKPLWKLTVNNGKNVVPVVCGAPNCRVGMKVAFAKVGAVIGDINVGVANLAGEESHGMCCSGRELGISEDHDGIIDLIACVSGELVNGTPIEKVIPVVDVIFEIDNKSLTNRPDLWGHYGIARELSVIFNKKLKKLPVADLEKYKDLPSVPVTIENAQDCYSFGAFKVENINRRVSPIWMQIRLFYCDISSHGFLVDLSNYIMLELGQPNHAFDASKIGKLSAGNVNSGEFTTLKDQVIQIKPHHLFIKSDGKPVSLAGIMGGANSLICPTTRDVVFEFATFNPTTIRKTSSELGIRSDSSTRYEKGLDTNLNREGAARVIKILLENDKSACVVSSFNHQVASATKGGTIRLSKAYLERFCGQSFNYADVKRSLKGLGFEPVITKNEIVVTTPTWRATKDINIPVDIIEEIVRTFGYDNIVPRAPRVELAPVEPLARLERMNLLKNLLVSKYALNEVHTYIWNDTKALKTIKVETPSYLKITNSVTPGMENIRCEILPSLLNVVSKNKGKESIRIFESGKTYKNGVEFTYVGIVLGSRKKESSELYTELAHLLNDVLGTLGYRVSYEIGKAGKAYMHPKNNADVLTNGKMSAKIGIIHPTVQDAIDPKLNMAIAQINMEFLPEMGAETKQNVTSKYPKTTLDFTITTDKIYSNLERVFDGFKHELNMGYRLKDVYVRDNDEVSYTVQFTIGSLDRTLTGEEINATWFQIVEHGRKNGFVVDNT
ncbi:MAG: phenylalanine--tRNA ligase subunit beta [Firmicutes bacterium]|nr:phenylalanine--tRNA ligase subunit beta [Bacillota bacterium]